MITLSNTFGTSSNMFKHFGAFDKLMCKLHSPAIMAMQKHAALINQVAFPIQQITSKFQFVQNHCWQENKFARMFSISEYTMMSLSTHQSSLARLLPQHCFINTTSLMPSIIDVSMKMSSPLFECALLQNKLAWETGLYNLRSELSYLSETSALSEDAYDSVEALLTAAQELSNIDFNDIYWYLAATEIYINDNITINKLVILSGLITILVPTLLENVVPETDYKKVSVIMSM